MCNYYSHTFQRPSPDQPCHQEEEGTPPLLLPVIVHLGGGRGEIVGWSVQSTSIHDDMIQNMTVKLLTSWLEFLLRTENLNTWQRSIGRTLKLNWFDYKQCLAIHTVIQFEQNTIAICGDIKWVCSREFHLIVHAFITHVHVCTQLLTISIHSVLE